MEVTGKIKMINPTQVVSDKFSKREFVVTTNETYPQDLMMQITQDKCNLLDIFKVGENVTVSFNLRGREWTNPQGEVKYFNSLEAWKIFKDTNVEHNDTKDAPVENDGLPF